MVVISNHGHHFSPGLTQLYKEIRKYPGNQFLVISS